MWALLAFVKEVSWVDLIRIIIVYGHKPLDLYAESISFAVLEFHTGIIGSRHVEFIIEILDDKILSIVVINTDSTLALVSFTNTILYVIHANIYICINLFYMDIHVI